MKLKLTPLFLVAAGLALYGLYKRIFIDPAIEGWETFESMMIVGAGIAGLFVYAALREILKTKIWTQVVVEAILVISLLWLWYKKY
jgi:hypothetical protein